MHSNISNWHNNFNLAKNTVCSNYKQTLTAAVFNKYFLKLSVVICGKRRDGGTSVFSKSSPHVFLKKSVSRRASVGSFNTAGKLTRDIKMVHWSWSRTTDGADCANSDADTAPLSVGLRNVDCLPDADAVGTSFRSATQINYKNNILNIFTSTTCSDMHNSNDVYSHHMLLSYLVHDTNKYTSKWMVQVTKILPLVSTQVLYKKYRTHQRIKRVSMITNSLLITH